MSKRTPLESHQTPFSSIFHAPTPVFIISRVYPETKTGVGAWKISNRGFGDLGLWDREFGGLGGLSFTSSRGRADFVAVTNSLFQAFSMNLALFSSWVECMVFMKTGVGAWKMLEKWIWRLLIGVPLEIAKQG